MMSLCPNPDPELQTDHEDAHATNTRSLDGALGTRGGPTEPLESRIWAIPALTKRHGTSTEINILLNCSKIQTLPQKTISYVM